MKANISLFVLAVLVMILASYKIWVCRQCQVSHYNSSDIKTTVRNTSLNGDVNRFLDVSSKIEQNVVNPNFSMFNYKLDVDASGYNTPLIVSTEESELSSKGQSCQSEIEKFDSCFQELSEVKDASFNLKENSTNSIQEIKELNLEISRLKTQNHSLQNDMVKLEEKAAGTLNELSFFYGDILRLNTLKYEVNSKDDLCYFRIPFKHLQLFPGTIKKLNSQARLDELKSLSSVKVEYFPVMRNIFESLVNNKGKVIKYRSRSSSTGDTLFEQSLRSSQSSKKSCLEMNVDYLMVFFDIVDSEENDNFLQKLLSDGRKKVYAYSMINLSS